MNGEGGESVRGSLVMPASARGFGFNPAGFGGGEASGNGTPKVVIYEPSGREAGKEGPIKSNFYGIAGSDLVYADAARPRQNFV